MLQSEEAECGLACLVMIGNHFGHELDLNGLRAANPISQRGMDATDIVDIAKKLNLTARVVRGEPEQLSQLQLPAILHWDMKHFVVLRHVDKGGLIIDDPALGRRRTTTSEVNQSFTGIAIELSPTSAFEPLEVTRPTNLGHLFGGLQGWRSSVGQIFVFSVVAQFGLLATPLIIQYVVDRVAITGKDELLPAVLVGFLCVAALTAFASFIRGWHSIYLGNVLLFQAASRLMGHLQNLPVSFFEARHPGDLISRVGSLRPVQVALSNGSIAALLDGAFIVLILLYIFMYSVSIGLFALLTIVALIVSLLFFQGQLRIRDQDELRASAEEQSHILETIRNIRTTQIFGREAVREAAWRNKYTQVLNRVASAGRIRLWMQFTEQIVLASQLAGFMFLGVQSLMTPDGISIGALAALISLQQLMAARVTGFTRELTQFLTVRVHLNRLGDIVHAEPRTAPLPSSAGLVVKGGLELKDVSFRYPGTGANVLNEISMEVPAGAFVALTGRSGAGKSTLLKIMIGLLEPTSGAVLVDGARLTMPIAPLWRKSTATVMQDDRLFTGSILENIAFFEPQPDIRRAREACAQAEILDFIESLPMGFHSLIGDLGASFSGGQVQRLFLARALYRRPQILFLDEGTANLDLDSEARIVETLTDLPITRFVIAHRPALIERADYVYELDQGMCIRTR